MLAKLFRHGSGKDSAGGVMTTYSVELSIQERDLIIQALREMRVRMENKQCSMRLRVKALIERLTGGAA